ncbi:epidermal growth factor receptor kinase substrate 8-like protein 1 [Lates japonicus]|uniref:Epidermal growth factor receptor kinase substrate 8-like protein 1 n=1 Tax=Lates japonicus TaxID=270547 RepID=A0AAD3MQ36_LATJO|nr:epidermal growth factor receptor kinase substrate 8-like protein 1 [Lates japonicus]
MTNISRYLVNHLLTFSLQDGDVQSLEEAQSRLSSHQLKQQAMESTGIPWMYRSGGHSTQRHTEPGFLRAGDARPPRYLSPHGMLPGPHHQTLHLILDPEAIGGRKALRAGRAEMAHSTRGRKTLQLLRLRSRTAVSFSVQQGETLERWWKCRNRFNQIVPFNILEPVAHIDSPVTNRPPSALPPPLTKTFSVVPPSPPALPQAPTHSPQRPRSLPAYSQHLPAAEDTDKVMMVNDELLQRLTNGKANLNKPLVIPRSSETSVPLDYHSPPEEVAEWLRGKGFSEPTVSCLGVLTGAQLFSLNKEELRAVIPDEGARVYSQLTVQKALLEDARRATELEAVMEKQKMKVDLKLESSTL